MTPTSSEFCFEQCHLDVARYATDDFNLFHDSHRWRQIRHNPYRGPIVLGFQLEALVDVCIEQAREGEGQAMDTPWSNYEFHFAEALRPGEWFAVNVRPSRRHDGALTTRAAVRKHDGSPLILATRADGPCCHFPADALRPLAEAARAAPDRSFLQGSGVFVKRKFLNTSNGKNFLLGALVDPMRYFDELDNRVQFPAMFTASLLSCALLERGQAAGYDFRGDPQVYVTHRLSVNRAVQRALRSNDRLDFLVAPSVPVPAGRGLADTQVARLTWPCLVVAAGRGVLLEGEVTTAELHAVIGR